MDWDKIIQRLAVIIPAIHIASCGIYIVGYSVGFQDQIASLFSPSDFITITFNNLVLLYTSSIILPGLIVLMRHRTGATYAQDSIDAASDEKVRTALQKQLSFMRGLIKIFLVLTFLFSLAIILLTAYLNAFPRYQILLVMLTLSFSVLFYGEAGRHNIHGLRAELAWIGLVFFVAVFGFALDQGIRDRRLSYDDLGNSYFYCKNLKVLSPVGVYYIAVEKGGRRFIINDECKAIFAFNKKEAPIKGSLLSALRKHIFP